jgi:hypothetical protein
MNSPVHGIVFSYNRAMQLDATLRSFYLHCRDAQLVHLTVLMKADDPNYAHQYQSLALDYPQVTFYPEEKFRKDALKILTACLTNPFVRLWLLSFSYLLNTQHIRIPFIKGAIKDQARKMRERIASEKNRLHDKPYTLFLVDDNVFVSDFSMKHVIQALESCPDGLGFSLRLGKNTSYCYARDSNQRLPSFSQVNQKVICYTWPEADFDFGYPLEISSSVFCGPQIAALVSTLQFNQPNKLEGVLAACSHLFRETYPHLLCFETSVTFCNPINKVQQFFSNRAGEAEAFSVQALAERFDCGERINVNELDGFVPNSCHQDIEFIFNRFS